MKVVCITLFVLASLAVCTASSYYGSVCDPKCGNLIFDCGLRKPFSFECPDGFEKDSCGCQTSCNCAGCPLFDKGLACPFGKKADKHGCPLSECKCGPCPINECGLKLPEFVVNCPRGFKRNACGCETCQCKGCPDVDFNIGCKYGRKVDSNNCPTNQCNPPPCEFAGDCAAVLCQFGAASDSDGCPLKGCPCQGAPDCPAVDNCNLDCSFSIPGSPFPPVISYKTDSRGCVLCACDPPEKPGSCPPRYAVPRNSASCKNDYDCRGTQKCCQRGYYRSKHVCSPTSKKISHQLY